MTIATAQMFKGSNYQFCALKGIFKKWPIFEKEETNTTLFCSFSDIKFNKLKKFL